MIKIEKVPNGIEITLTDKKEFIEEYPEMLPDVYDLLDSSGYLGNGWDDGTDRCNFALTSSPIFVEDAEYDEETNIICDAENIYWFPNYQVENPFETLYKEGKVFFEGSK